MSNWVLHWNFHRQLVAKNFWNDFNPGNWALHRNFHRLTLWQRISEIILVQAIERYLKISIDSLGLRISETFVQANGYYVHGNFYRFFGREYLNLSWLSLYCPSNWVLHENFHRQLVAKNFSNKFNPGNWALYRNFYRVPCGKEYPKPFCQSDWHCKENISQTFLA